MKYPASHKEEVHNRLLANASQQIRDVGIAKVSVKSVMESEGMTVGGFYAHFDSKEDLVSEAIAAAFAHSFESFYDRIDGKTDNAWTKTVIERYLSDYHRDTQPLSCPAATLMGDVARADDSIKQLFEKNLKDMITRFEPRVGKSKSIGLVAILVGGLQLARSVSDEKYSKDILKSCIRNAKSLVNG